ncbi:MAG: DUF4198 domain-containing protein [Phenylobacterium zucineum]|nr:MAG: DUF4198 domain-containing protein [Phenylobacterium zucineum]
MRWSVGLIAAVVASAPALAHTPYLLPNTFDATGRDHVTIEASFTETFFAPEVVMKSDDFKLIGPDGVEAALSPTYFKDLTILEAGTAKDGTWRITSGHRVGRTAKAHLVKGEWEFLDPREPIPAGVNAVDMQSLTTAETYVTRGAPNDAALKPYAKGLEFRPITHPSSVFVGKPAQFEVLLEGRPLAKQVINIYREGQDADAGKPLAVTSDAQGRFSVTLDRPGVFLAMTRYRIAPQGAAPGRSLTYALTFEAGE